MKRLIYNKICMAALLLAGILSACSDSAYVDVIPRQSVALVSVDAARLTGVQSGVVLKTLLKATDLGNCGIDVAEKIYFFETADGNLGICASVDDASLLSSAFEKAGCEIEEKRGYRYAVAGGTWLAAFSADALLVMGPVLLSDKAAMQNRMARYLSQDEGQGVTSSPLFACLDSIDAPMAVVAQASALPSQLVMPLMLGAPKYAEPSQIVLKAAVSISSGVMYVDGTTFSFNKRIDTALRKSYEMLRPVNGRYLKSMPADAASGMFLNVDGGKFIDIMRSNRMLHSMLAGINAAIDMDNIIKSIDGELAVVTPSYADGKARMSMAAELAHSGWLADVPYWKESVPQGAQLIDWRPDAYIYTGGSTSFCFGVTADKQFYSGGSTNEAEQSIALAANPISNKITDRLKGKRLALVVNVAALGSGNASAVSAALRPVIGNVETIVITMK